MFFLAKNIFMISPLERCDHKRQKQKGRKCSLAVQQMTSHQATTVCENTGVSEIRSCAIIDLVPIYLASTYIMITPVITDLTLALGSCCGSRGWAVRLHTDYIFFFLAIKFCFKMYLFSRFSAHV